MKRMVATAICGLLLLLACAAAAEIYVNVDKPEGWDQRELMRLVVFPTYQSDCMVLECGGETMFLEGAREEWHDRVAEALQRFGYTHVDYLYSSHPHPDHIQNMCRLLQSGDLTGELFLTPFAENYEYEYLQEMEETLAEKGIPYYQLQEGEVWQLGGAEMKLLRWRNANLINAMSGVWRVTFGGCTILLNSDIDGETERHLLEQYGADALQADIMTAPHHGLMRLLAEYVEGVNPGLVIIDNDRVKSETQTNQYTKRDINLLYNDDGIIILETDGADWYITQLDGWAEETVETKSIW